MNALTTPKASEAVVMCPDCRAEHAVQRVCLFGRDVTPKLLLCPACEANAARQRAETERITREAKLANQWIAVCPPLYRDTDPARLPQEAVWRIVGWQYGPCGLLLIGPTGTGKTRAMFLLLHRLMEREGFGVWLAPGVPAAPGDRQLAVFDAVDFAHQAGRRFRDGSGDDWADALAKVALVAFDDLGKSPLTERVEAELFALIERRAANMVPIIATSNMTGAQLEAKASGDRGAAMVRRLREFNETVVFGG